MTAGAGAAIRAALEGPIRSGAWPPGTRIPTEQALAAAHGCARMTVNRVLAEMAGRGLIVRRRRAGSFVAAAPVEHAALGLDDFVAEAARGGRRYRHCSGPVGRVRASGSPFADGEALLSVATLHLFDEVPVAEERRLIRAASVPAPPADGFAAEAPGAWLQRHVPWSEAWHEIGAVCADAARARRLEVPPGAPLLTLHRRTWHEGAAVTDVRLHFPAARYRFTGRFTPG